MGGRWKHLFWPVLACLFFAAAVSALTGASIFPAAEPPALPDFEAGSGGGQQIDGGSGT